MSAPVRQSVALYIALNRMFGLRLPDSAAGRAWLRDGGWERLEEWIKVHRNDPDGEEAQPETEENTAP